VQVTVSPLGCRALFGRPAAEIAHQDVDAAELLGPLVVDEVRHGLLTAPDWPGRFAVLDRVLARVVHDYEVAPQIAYAIKRMRTHSVSIAKLADEVGWSGRHLTDRFRAEVGLRPKEVARVARFDRARRALRPSARLADVAAAFGFADQSHFVREFHSFAGCAPSRWIADEFGFVQAQAARDADDGLHE
jgi:AraC-like DNA-binding protein